MPMIRHYTITATVEMDIDGPYSYAQAIQLAEELLTRIDQPEDKVLNGIRQVRVASLSASRRP